MCDCWFAFIFIVAKKDRVLQPVFWVASNIAFYGAFIFFHVSPNNSHIFPFAGFIKKLFGQMCHGLFVFGNNQKATGIFIDSMYQSCTITGIVVQIIKMINQSIT